MTDTYWCRIHDHYLPGIPADVVALPGERRGAYTLYKFADGSLHDIRKRDNRTNLYKFWHSQHSRNGRKTPGCKFCFPESEVTVQQPAPQATVEQSPEIMIGDSVTQLKVITEALAEMKSESKQVAEETQSAESGNIMAAALKRFKGEINE